MTGTSPPDKAARETIASELFGNHGRMAGALLLGAGSVLALSLALLVVPSEWDLVRRVVASRGSGWLAVALLIASAASRAWPPSILTPASEAALRAFCLLTAVELAIGFLSWNREVAPIALDVRDALPWGQATSLAAALLVLVRTGHRRRTLIFLVAGSLLGPLAYLLSTQVPVSPTALRAVSACALALLGLELCGGVLLRLGQVATLVRRVLDKR